MYMPADNEHVLAMENFSGMLKTVHCTQTSMTLEFKDRLHFQYAQKIWGWVDEAERHSFIIVVGARDCEWNEHRQPFRVTATKFNTNSNMIILAAKSSDWQSVAHSYDLVAGHVPKSHALLQRRALSKQFALSVAGTFPFSVNLYQHDFVATVTCLACTTSGHINLDFEMSTRHKIPTKATMKITANGVGADITLRLAVTGFLRSIFVVRKNMVTVPLDAITIPGVFDLGPKLDFDFGMDLDTFSITGFISGGGILTISDGSTVKVNLLNPADRRKQGWKVHFTPIPLNVDAVKVSAGVDFFIETLLYFAVETMSLLPRLPPQCYSH